MATQWRVGNLVYDRWWPWRVGRVEHVGRRSVRVRWPDDVWTYDPAHLPYLELAGGDRG